MKRRASNPCKYPLPRYRSRVVTLSPCYYIRVGLLWAFATIGAFHALYSWLEFFWGLYGN